MNLHYLPRLALWLLRFLKLQLFISLFSMPILLWWGIPISVLSPIGNLIFGPALTLFLLLSSLLFFTELFYIPNNWIARCLEMTTQAWMYCMKSDSHRWLCGFAKPSIVFSIVVPLIALLILHYKKFKHIGYSVLCFTVLILGSCLYLKIAHTKTSTIELLPCNRGEVTLLFDKEHLVVIDPGVIGQRISIASWVEYTLIPHIIKTSGKTTIDTLILLQPGAMLFEAVSAMVSKIKVKEIYLVCWRGSLAKHEWARFFAMQRAFKEQGVTMHRIADEKLHISSSGTSSLTIAPLKFVIRQKEINYPALKVSGTMDGKPFEVYSQKYKGANTHI